MLELYRERVKGTTIDAGTLLSTDYFNLFNEVIMLLGMLGDMPDMLDEVIAWKFKTYEQHFAESGLAFAPLAIEAYPHAPPSAREHFERTIQRMHDTVEEAKLVLADLREQGDVPLLAEQAMNYSMMLQQMVDTGSAIIHGIDGILDQSAIDDLF
ncbi:hypothetical protein GCM10011611_52170 [Aliidongia dinghuensis]|uniref:Uncharacterized protein n=1 Tax=Aliidongia dinghuensis TaxID=1867774 RepID=A0A8J2YZ74_9PROT|nr:hypothetical protein [Aliidongia dinghuensis]GGF39336.1 hypothetical protein GCM10011611_52170 [Aliidongia dinghuensis]